MQDKITKWLSLLENMPTDFPTTFQLWEEGRRLLAQGKFAEAQKCQLLIKLLHSSYVPIRLDLGENTLFANGGLGVVLHPNAEMGKGILVGTNVLVGGNRKPYRYSEKYEKQVTLPQIGDYTWIGTGSKVLGGVTVGAFSVIGASSVVMKNLPVGAIAVGSPARIIRKITPDNAIKNRSYFTALAKLDDDSFYELFCRYYDSSTDENI